MRRLLKLGLCLGTALALGAACDDAGFNGGGGTKSSGKAPVGRNGATEIPVGEKTNAKDLIDGDKLIKSGMPADPEIASYNEKTGEITGLKPGETTIKVTFEDGTTGEIKVVVTDGKGSGTGSPAGSGSKPKLGSGSEPGSSELKLDASENGSGNADVVFEDKEAGVRRELFEFGGDAQSPLVDFIIVLDNSVSMQDIANKTAAGFASIAAGDLFPAKAQVAVMTTMASKRDNFTTTHPEVERYPAIDQEPGFLGFVDDAAIQSYKGTNGSKADKYPLKGCEKWFKPGAKNANGQACMAAHTQSAFTGVGVEPGITAVHQLLLKHKGTKLFRKGANVNFVFVTDTHDPGRGGPAGDLVSARPTLDAIRTALEADNVVAGLKFHAIAPEKKCTAEDVHDKSYFVLVDATKGAKGDPCASDYAPIVKALAENAAKPEKGVFSLSKSASEIVSVLIDGKETDQFELDAAKDTLTVKGLDPAKISKVEVVYRFNP